MAHITSVNVRVDDETKNRIAAIAQFYEKTISELVREWFDDCIELEEGVIAKITPELENL